MEVTAPWLFCTWDVLAKPEFPTPLLAATRLFLTRSLLSNSSFPKMKKLPFTRAFLSPTFPTAHLPRCTSQRCLHMPQPFETVRCLSIFPNCPSNFPYLTLPAPQKQHPLQTPQRCLQYPPLLGLLPFQSSSTLVSTPYLSLQDQFVFLWWEETKIKFSSALSNSSLVFCFFAF